MRKVYHLNAKVGKRPENDVPKVTSSPAANFWQPLQVSGFGKRPRRGRRVEVSPESKNKGMEGEKIERLKKLITSLASGPRRKRGFNGEKSVDP